MTCQSLRLSKAARRSRSRHGTGDGHEDGFARAIAQMLGEKGARIGKGNRGHKGNSRTNAFLTELRNRANPLDMEYPRDIKKAESGQRMKNIRAIERVCKQMITVKRC